MQNLKKPNTLKKAILAFRVNNMPEAETDYNTFMEFLEQHLDHELYMSAEEQLNELIINSQMLAYQQGFDDVAELRQLYDSARCTPLTTYNLKK